MGITTELTARIDTLQKLVFAEPTEQGGESRVTVRPILLGGKAFFQLAAQHGTQVTHRNVPKGQLAAHCENTLFGHFRSITICTESETRQYVLKRDGTYRCTAKNAEKRAAAPLTHNREKQYLLAEGENVPALVDLGIFTPDFRIVKSKYDKYRQINRFLEIVDDAFAEMRQKEITILDFGCGKSYLTFLLYYYFTVKRGVRAKIIGYDLKEDVIEKCSRSAAAYGYDDLHFYRADVTRDVLYGEKIDMIVTLHACDTATDHALYYALTHHVPYIFSVPCCQHEVNARIRKGGDFDILLSHGLFQERFSALLTDAIRTAVLEDMGYRVDVLEFVDFSHSPKNVMLRAVADGAKSEKRRKTARELAERYHFRQTLLDLLDGRREAP